MESEWLKLYQNNNVIKSEDGERITCRSAPASKTDPLYTVPIQQWCIAETEPT